MLICRVCARARVCVPSGVLCVCVRVCVCVCVCARADRMILRRRENFSFFHFRSGILMTSMGLRSI